MVYIFLSLSIMPPAIHRIPYLQRVPSSYLHFPPWGCRLFSSTQIILYRVKKKYAAGRERQSVGVSSPSLTSRGGVQPVITFSRFILYSTKNHIERLPPAAVQDAEIETAGVSEDTFLSKGFSLLKKKKRREREKAFLPEEKCVYLPDKFYHLFSIVFLPHF